MVQIQGFVLQLNKTAAHATLTGSGYKQVIAKLIRFITNGFE